MESNLEATDIESLTKEQKEAFLIMLLAACARGTMTVEPAGIKRFTDAIVQLPIVLNTHAVEDLIEEAKVRYDSLDDEAFSNALSELAAKLPDPVLREKLVVAANQAAAGTTVLPSPSYEQADALVCGMLLAAAGGSTLGEEGVQRFRAAADKLPALLDATKLGEEIASANAEYDGQSSPDVASWAGTIGALITDVKLRERTFAAIGHVPKEARGEDVTWFFDKASLAFGIASDRMTFLRQMRAAPLPLLTKLRLGFS